MLGIVVFPETVVHPVDADFDELEIIPFERGHQVPDHLEVLPRHVVNLIAEPFLVVGAEALYVHRILAHQTVDLLPHAGRVGVIVSLGVGGHEAPHVDTVHLARWIAGRHADHHDIFVLRA